MYAIFPLVCVPYFFRRLHWSLCVSFVFGGRDQYVKSTVRGA
jgi:hypothetical protein